MAAGEKFVVHRASMVSFIDLQKGRKGVSWF